MNKSDLAFTPSIDLLHWSIGLKLELPRKTKHVHHRWIFKARFACFGLQIARKNNERIPLAPRPGTPGDHTT